MQQLGDLMDEEIEEFKKIEPNIRKNIGNTFGRPFPTCGVLSGLILQVVPLKFRLSVLFHLTTFMVPVFVDVIYRKFDVSHKHKTMEFLNWSFNRRTAQAILEKNQDKIDQIQMKKFEINFGKVNCLNLFKQYLKLN